MYAHQRNELTSTIEDVNKILFSPKKRKKSRQSNTPTVNRRKRKGVPLANVKKRSKCDSEARLIANNIRSLWIAKEITKDEIGLRLLEKTVGSNGEVIKSGKRLVQEIVKLLVQKPMLAPYKTIRGWITAARKAKIKYGDSVRENFSIAMKAGAPPLADSAQLIRYVDSETLHQKAGNLRDLKKFLNKQLRLQHDRRNLQVCVNM